MARLSQTSIPPDQYPSRSNRPDVSPYALGPATPSENWPQNAPSITDETGLPTFAQSFADTTYGALPEDESADLINYPSYGMDNPRYAPLAYQQHIGAFAPYSMATKDQFMGYQPMANPFLEPPTIDPQILYGPGSVPQSSSNPAYFVGDDCAVRDVLKADHGESVHANHDRNQHTEHDANEAAEYLYAANDLDYGGSVADYGGNAHAQYEGEPEVATYQCLIRNEEAFVAAKAVYLNRRNAITDTFPRDETVQRQLVSRIVRAIRNVQGVKDNLKVSKTFQDSTYPHLAVEMVSWELLVCIPKSICRERVLPLTSSLIVPSQGLSAYWKACPRLGRHKVGGVRHLSGTNRKDY